MNGKENKVMCNCLLTIIQLVLAQNEAQKNETYFGICVLAILGCIFIIDVFAKDTIAKEKSLKRLLLFFSCLAIFVFIILYFYLQKK